MRGNGVSPPKAVECYSLLNLADDVLENYRQPEGAAYREKIIISAEGSASPLAFPDVVIAMSEILPLR